MMDTREAFVNVLVEIHLNQQSLETCKKKQTNKPKKTLQTPTKRKPIRLKLGSLPSIE